MNTLINGQTKGSLTMSEAKAIRKFRDFGVEDAEAYATSLSQKNLVDLRTIAMNQGIKPASDRPKLVKRLIDNFNSARRDHDLALLKTK